MDFSHIAKADPEAERALSGEEKRQAEGLELIPSENYASRAVREALASAFTNKYAEGYPGKRYYGGQEFTDQVETLAIERAKKLFGAAFANVQPLGGAAANLATYFALAAPGDTILGMELSHGGHLTHGAPVTAAANIFRFVRYGMKDPQTGEIDYDALEGLARKEKPKIVLAGFSSYPRTLKWGRIANIARSIGALAVADVAHIAGLIAGGALQNPFEAGFDVLTTTTHKTLRGPRGGMILVRKDAELAQKIDKAVFPGLQGGPHMHQIAAKAIAFGEALHPSFKTYAAQVLKNAQAMARVFAEGGVTLVTGGTDNHLILADVFGSLGLSGADAERMLDSAGLTVNKNVIPDDARKPRDPSGIRFGSPALTTRGATEEDAAHLAMLMLRVLKNPKETPAVREEVRAFALAHPIPEAFA